MEKITLSLPTELLSRYATLSQEHNRSTAELMRDVLQEYIAKQQRILPDWIGIIDTVGDFDSTNVKDWLHQTWEPD